GVQQIRDAFALERGIARIRCFHHLKVQVRTIGVSRIAHLPENIAGMDVIARLYLQASRLKVHVTGILTTGQLENDIVSHHGIDGHLSAPRVLARRVVRDAIFHVGYYSIGDRERVASVSEPFLVPATLAASVVSFLVEPGPVDGEALGEVRRTVVANTED